MILRFAAAAFAVLLSIAPVLAQTCMTWENGVAVAAKYSADNDVRVAAVLLTPAETMAVFPMLMPNEVVPARFGVMISNDDPEKAFVAGFDESGCLVGSGGLPMGQVIDAMVAADVKSEFVIVEPEAPAEGA